MVLMKYVEGTKDCYICSDGTVIGTKGKPLRWGLSTTGYPIVVLTYKNGEVKTKVVHRLVAEYFIPRIEGKILLTIWTGTS